MQLWSCGLNCCTRSFRAIRWALESPWTIKWENKNWSSLELFLLQKLPFALATWFSQQLAFVSEIPDIPNTLHRNSRLHPFLAKLYQFFWPDTLLSSQILAIQRNSKKKYYYHLMKNLEFWLCSPTNVPENACGCLCGITRGMVGEKIM